MDADVLKTVGQVAGIGGLSLGVLLLLFRDIIRKNIFPKLPPQEAYKLLRLIALAVWSVAVIGIAAWVYTEADDGNDVIVGPGGSGVGGDVVDSNIIVGPAPELPEEQAPQAKPVQ